MSSGSTAERQAVLTWTAGAWFGSQIGATAWMLVGGLLALGKDVASGTTALLLFAVANALGLALWRTRRLSCYASTQVLVAVAGVCGLACVYALDRGGVWNEIQVGGQVSAPFGYGAVLLTFGGVMLAFHLRFGRASRS